MEETRKGEKGVRGDGPVNCAPTYLPRPSVFLVSDGSTAVGDGVVIAA
jgi:hypothetical protein